MAVPPLVIKLRCTNWSQVGSIYERDLKNGTLFLRTPAPLSLGRSIRVDLVMPSGSVVNLDGRVAHLVPPGDRGPGVELVLSKLTPSAMWLIESALARITEGSAEEPRQDEESGEAEQALSGALESELRGFRLMNPYQVLGIPYGAGAEFARAAFAELSKKYHPDRFARFESERVRTLASEIFMVLREAYRRIAADPTNARPGTPARGVPTIPAPRSATPAQGIPIPQQRPATASESPWVDGRRGTPVHGVPTFAAGAPGRQPTPAQGVPIIEPRPSGGAAGAGGRARTPAAGVPVLDPRSLADPSRESSGGVRVSGVETRPGTAAEVRRPTPAQGVPLAGNNPAADARVARGGATGRGEDRSAPAGSDNQIGGSRRPTPAQGVPTLGAPVRPSGADSGREPGGPVQLGARPVSGGETGRRATPASGVPIVIRDREASGVPELIGTAGETSGPRRSGLNADDLFGDLGDIPVPTGAPPLALEAPDVARADALLESGKTDEALAAYESVLKADPTSRAARAGRELAHGLKLSAAGDKARAAERFELALEIEPWSERAARELANLRRAATERGKGLLAKLLGKGS